MVALTGAIGSDIDGVGAVAVRAVLGDLARQASGLKFVFGFALLLPFAARAAGAAWTVGAIRMSAAGRRLLPYLTTTRQERPTEY